MELTQLPARHTVPVFLADGGEMGGLIAEYNWSATSVGSMDSWPATLKIILNTILRSRFPMFLWWGADLVQFYNDAYRPAMGNDGKHPTALGQKGEDCWAEIWPDIKPLIDRVLLHNESIWSENQLLPIYRNGRMEDVYWTFSYSPVNDENGAVSGVLVVCSETTGQVNTINKIKRSEERFQDLVRETSVGIVVMTGEEMKVEIVNAMYGQLINRTPEELMGRPLFDIIPELTDPFLGMLNKVRTTGEPIFLYDQPYKVHPNGGIKEGYVNVIYQPYKDREGVIIGVMAVCQDVTEQVNAKKNIEQAEAKARLAIMSADLGTYEIDLVTNEMITSERFNAIWGVDHSVQRPEYVNYIHPDHREVRQKAHEEAIRTGDLHYEAKLMWDDGSEHWVKVNGKVIYDDNGGAKTLLGVIQDITEQKTFAEQLVSLVEARTSELQRINTELQASEERYHKMVAEVEDYAILFLDTNGIIQNWNKGAEKIKGYKDEEVVGRSFKIFYLQEDRASGLPESLIAYAKEHGKAVQEGWRQRKDGTRFWGSIVITALHDNDNNIVGFSKVTRDLTERKLAEDRIQKYTHELELQNEELKQFAFVASHDMKEPLRKVIFNNSFLSERINDRLNDKEREAMQRSIDAAKRMQNLIDDILTYSQTTFADHIAEEVDLNTVLHDVVADLQDIIDETGAIVKWPEMPTIKGISHQMKQLFDNLINNAIKYRHTERRPEITIGYEQTQVAGVDNATSNGDYHKLTVADNGIGFDQKDAEKIFDLFYRLKSKKESGSGIGLAICRKIVLNHDGWIEAHGKTGVGASFDIYLPVQ